jgi:hypothetical protein
MQSHRIPPHIAAVALTVTIFLFVAGLLVANAASQRSDHVAPGTFLVHSR